MRVFTHAVIDIATGRTLVEDSYDYVGPVAHAKGTPDVPPKSAAELEIEKLNLAALQRSAKLEEDLEPFVLQSLRLTRENGAIRQMTDEEFRASLSPSELLAHENLLATQERQAKALAGELPLTEAGQQKKAEEFRIFKEAMARSGNPITGETPETATATTTPGIQGLRAFNQRFGLLEEAERFGELSRGTSSILQRLGITSDIAARERAGLLDFPTGPLRRTQVGTQALQPFQFDRALQFQANVIGSQNQAAFTAGLLELAGTIGGAAAGGAFAKKPAPAPA